MAVRSLILNGCITRNPDSRSRRWRGSVAIRKEYEGREQTYLKHRVLQEYLRPWAHKLGSLAKFGRTKLWYVDCFAGPWENADEELRDTSIAIGLMELRTAAATWRNQGGHKVDLGAIFVEKNEKSFAALSKYLEKNGAGIDVVAIPGEFESAVDQINKKVGNDPAFLFVDPTGWKGVGMKYIAPLASAVNRDVLINVMFNDLNRFKDDRRAFLRTQIAEFFGLGEGEIPAGLDEESLFELYRNQVKSACRVPLVADLVIPHPTKERTWFRLVVGAHHRASVKLFRDVERSVCGEEAAEVRDAAKNRGNPQLSLLVTTPEADQSYDLLHGEGSAGAASDVLQIVGRGPVAYEALWPQVLMKRHITLPDLNKIVFGMHRKGELVIRGLGARELTPKDSNVIGLPEHRPR
jgi:three-Cys-motif partner protein